MANEVEFVTVAAKPSVVVPLIPRDLAHLGLGHRGVVVILAV